MRLSVTPQEFKDNVEEIIRLTRVIKPNSDIVLVSTTPTDVFPNRWGGARPFIDALYQLSVKYQYYMVDLYDVFGTVDPAKWRYDNVHTTISGGNYVYRHIRNLVFPSIKIADGYFPDSEFQVVPSVVEETKSPNRVSLTFDSSGDAVIDPSDARHIEVSVSASGEISIKPSPSLRISDAYMFVSPPSQFYIAGAKAYFGTGIATYVVLNALASPPPCLQRSPSCRARL
ncbi:SGNH/GDSL hydrolase family protein [Pseudomonas brenneri]